MEGHKQPLGGMAPPGPHVATALRECPPLSLVFYAFLNKFWKWTSLIPASWSSGNVFVSGAGSMRFQSQASQIGHSASNGLPPLRHFFERSCVARAQWRGDGPCKLAIRFGLIHEYDERFDFEDHHHHHHIYLFTKWRYITRRNCNFL